MALTGKDWIEGIHTTDTASPGEPTWNQQKFGSVNWGTPGATDVTDIDQATSITWDKTGGLTESISLNVTPFVDGWVNGGIATSRRLR